MSIDQKNSLAEKDNEALRKQLMEKPMKKLSNEEMEKKIKEKLEETNMVKNASKTVNKLHHDPTEPVVVDPPGSIEIPSEFDETPNPMGLDEILDSVDAIPEKEQEELRKQLAEKRPESRMKEMKEINQGKEKEPIKPSPAVRERAFEKTIRKMGIQIETLTAERDQLQAKVTELLQVGVTQTQKDIINKNEDANAICVDCNIEFEAKSTRINAPGTRADGSLKCPGCGKANNAEFAIERYIKKYEA